VKKQKKSMLLNVKFRVAFVEPQKST